MAESERQRFFQKDKQICNTFRLRMPPGGGASCSLPRRILPSRSNIQHKLVSFGAIRAIWIKNLATRGLVAPSSPQAGLRLIVVANQMTE
jgi:hypothetical protein